MKKSDLTVAILKEGILKQNNVLLSRAITLLESQTEKDNLLSNSLIEEILPFTAKSLRIGITGTPGVGKSTFIDSFVDYLAKNNKKVAVLAVDPSSRISGGSILGDKTRMEKLINTPNVFIRPSPAGTILGGVAHKTYETILLCEAAGYEIIIIETVGVGQSETIVKDMTDIVLLLTAAGGGDDLQGIKRGIMEMVDLVFINKTDELSDLELKKLISQYEHSLHMLPKNIAVNVISGSAINGTGIELTWHNLQNIKNNLTNTGDFKKKRKDQKINWLIKTFEGLVLESIYKNPMINEQILLLKNLVINNKISPINAAKNLEKTLFSKIK